jgi:hypothetical protein
MSLQTLPGKDEEERVLVAFDFSADLPSGDAVTVGEVAFEAIVAGADPSPAVIDGAPVLQSPNVLQWVTAGVDGATYRIKCKATTAQGRVLVLRALLPVRTVLA